MLECLVETLCIEVTTSPIEIEPYIGYNAHAHETLLFGELISTTQRILCLLPLIAKLGFTLFMLYMVTHHKEAMRKIFAHLRHARFRVDRRQGRSRLDEKYTHVVTILHAAFHIKMNHKCFFFQLADCC